MDSFGIGQLVFDVNLRRQHDARWLWCGTSVAKFDGDSSSNCALIARANNVLAVVPIIRVAQRFERPIIIDPDIRVAGFLDLARGFVQRHSTKIELFPKKRNRKTERKQPILSVPNAYHWYPVGHVDAASNICI